MAIGQIAIISIFLQYMVCELHPFNQLGILQSRFCVKENQSHRKPRILCLHGHGSTSERLKNLVFTKWPESVTQKLDLVFLDAPFPAVSSSGLEGYEWFHSNENFTEFTNFEEGVAYVEDYMVKNGPFDGILGFSQGAIFESAMPGMQAQGVAFGKVDKIKFLIVMSGAKFGGKKFGMPELASNAYSKIIDIPSLHFIGETDKARPEHIAMLEAFQDPVVIFHHEGHTVPKLDDKSLETVLGFIDTVQKMVEEGVLNYHFFIVLSLNQFAYDTYSSIINFISLISLF